MSRVTGYLLVLVFCYCHKTPEMKGGKGTCWPERRSWDPHGGRRAAIPASHPVCDRNAFTVARVLT